MVLELEVCGDERVEERYWEMEPGAKAAMVTSRRMRPLFPSSRRGVGCVVVEVLS